jgi:polysaccharide biosynthesis/export protein
MRKFIVLMVMSAVAISVSAVPAQSKEKKPGKAPKANAATTAAQQQVLPPATQPQTAPAAAQPPANQPPATPPPGQQDPAPAAQPQATPPAGQPAPPASVPPASVPSVVDTKTYVIGAEDVLRVLVWREPDLSGTFSVRPDGKISLPLVNEVQAAGLTPEKLSTTIGQGLMKYMTHPEVSVAVQQVMSKKYFIMGEVQKTGSFPLLIPTTVLEALVNAGGFRDFANTKKITIMRGTQRFYFNYKEVIKGKNREQNILLETGDQIIVP